MTYLCTRCSKEGAEPRRAHGERLLCDPCAALTPLVDPFNPPPPPVSTNVDTANGREEMRAIFRRLDARLGQTGRQVTARPLSGVKMRPIRWAWEGWVPLRGVSLLSGEGGLGKSTLLAYVAAHATRGTLPGELYGTPSDVLWLSFEDTLEEVLAPRLAAAGADLDRVHAIQAHDGDVEDLVTLPLDTEALGDLARERSARIVVVDPILSALAGGLDAHKSAEVRRALAPLQKLTESHDLTVLAVLHFKKSEESNPLARVEASGAFTHVARATLVFGVDPDGDGGREGPHRVLVHAKANYSRTHEAESFTIETAQVGPNLEIETTRLVANGASSVTAEDLSRPTSKDERSDLEHAKEAILEALADGPLKAEDLKNTVLADGHSDKTMRRARVALREAGRVEREKDGQGPWVWKAANKEATEQVGPLGPLGLLPHDVERAERYAAEYGDVNGSGQ